MEEKIKVGFCIAYDWELLAHALPAVYEASDEIFLSLDSQRKTWADIPYEWNQARFNNLISSIDFKNKVRIYEDNFHLGDLTTMENEVRQRNMLAAHMGQGGWHIQLDCDEYFIRFDEFVKYLKSLKPRNYKFNVSCSLITLFKQIDAGFLFVLPNALDRIEFIQIATRTPHYEVGRRNGDFNVYTNFKIIHQSWARSEADIRQKIKNWGHNNDFDQAQFLKSWKNLDESNFKNYANFHPINPPQWHSLSLVEAGSVEQFFHLFDAKKFPSFSSLSLKIKNSRFLSRARAFWKKMTRPQ